jgi:hypothetical protein
LETLTRRVFEVPAVVGTVTKLPPIVMTQPIAISGQVSGITASNSGNYFVTVESHRVAAPLSPTGTFVLNGLAPGEHWLEVQSFFGSPSAGLVIDVDTGPMAFYSGLAVPYTPNIVADPVSLKGLTTLSR